MVGYVDDAPIAQLAEQYTFNVWVVGSNPTGGTFFLTFSNFCGTLFV